MIRALCHFLEFCYLVRRNIITENSLSDIRVTLEWYHQYCEVFQPDVVSSFNLPRQHAMKHYPDMIRLFGAPNGLCSSIMESKHIKAVKQPYRRSNRHNTLGKMLLTNQQLDKLVACRINFQKHGMLESTCASAVLMNGSADSPTHGAAEHDHDDLIQPQAEEHNAGEDSEPVDLPMCVEAHVVLAHVPHECHITDCFFPNILINDDRTQVSLYSC